MLSNPVNIAHACTSKSFQWHCPTLKVLIDILLVAWGHILAKLHVEEKDSIFGVFELDRFYMISIHVWTIDVEFDPMLV